MNGLKDKCAIVGVGETDYSRDSGRTELSLAVEASKKAIADAGLLPKDIDGIVKFTADSILQAELAASLGIPYLRFYSELSTSKEIMLDVDYRGSGGDDESDATCSPESRTDR